MGFLHPVVYPICMWALPFGVNNFAPQLQWPLVEIHHFPLADVEKFLLLIQTGHNWKISLTVGWQIAEHQIKKIVE